MYMGSASIPFDISMEINEDEDHPKEFESTSRWLQCLRLKWCIGLITNKKIKGYDS